MQIDMGDPETVWQRPYPINVKHYDWVRSEIKKLLMLKLFTAAIPVGQHL